MDKCFYCGRQYHPMPVWLRKPESPADGKPSRIWVCGNWAIKQGEPEYEALDKSKIIREITTSAGTFAFVLSDCSEKAKADGYEYRRDLTPTR